MDNVIKKFFGDNHPDKLYTYEEFMSDAEEKASNSANGDDVYFEYRKINLHRTNRIQKTFKPNDELVELVSKISSPQTWLVITEDWCGDSAQNLPFIFNYVKENKNITFRIALRDTNLEAIDSYLKVGNPRSIPKVVVFDENAEELFIWGPRPKFAQDLVQQLKSEGYTKEEFNKDLHLWYGKNRGKELERELITILRAL